MNGKLNKFLTTWLGASYRTTVVGWLAGLVFAIIPVIQAGGIPQTQTQWMQVIGGAFIAYLGQSSKDKTVSNSQIAAPAHFVDTVVAPTMAAVVASEKKADKKPLVVNNP